MDFKSEIANLNNQIEEKQSKRKGVEADLYQAKQRLANEEATVRRLNVVCLGYSEAINKLATARDALAALDVAHPPVVARRPREVTPEIAETHTYEVVDTDDFRGRSGWYEIETVYVDKRFFVYRCDCPKFRFTGGEVANGKTCKHIDSFTQGRTRSTAQATARVAARRKGFRPSANADFRGGYTFHYS